MKFTIKEKRDLIYAGVMISLAFAILLSGGIFGFLTLAFYKVFIIAFFTAGIGFLFHELMHKYVAQSFGFFAEFRAYYKMLWVAILLSFFGFIFAAPGAVYIKGRISHTQNGKISLAGPLTNLILAFLFLILLLILDLDGISGSFLKFGLEINSLLATFNMIPFMPFDGFKVIKWNKIIYLITVFMGLGLFILSRVI